jgi:glucosamine--fructose-6-phosphate aminotransferase (isomerizing)
MIDYIHEGPTALRRTLEGNEAGIESLVEEIRRRGIRRVVISGVGSSFTAALMAAPAFRYHSTLPVHILPSTGHGYFASRLIDEHSLVVVVSRSGERDWVVNALQEAVERGAYGVAMTGVADSLLAQKGQATLLTQEGPEITFPKTKSVVTCAGLLMRLALALAAPGDGEAAVRLKTLRGLPGRMEGVLRAVEPEIQSWMPGLVPHKIVVVGGTGSNYGVALEAAVKLQETAYIPTLADDTGNVFHGPLGPLNREWLIISLVTAMDLRLSQQLLRIAGKFGAHRMVLVEPGLDVGGMAEFPLAIPERADPLLAALLYLPPMQLLTYYWTVSRGMNPDEPSVMRDMLDAMLPAGREEPELRGG